MNATRKLEWIGRLVRPLRVISYTQAQLDLFLRNHHIPWRMVRRVTSDHDIFGLNTDQPILLLPLWYHAKGDVHNALHWWKNRGGKVLEISENIVIGRAPLCPNDTNGDGDCHICAHKSACQWLVPEKPINP